MSCELVMCTPNTCTACFAVSHIRSFVATAAADDALLLCVVVEEGVACFATILL